MLAHQRPVGTAAGKADLLWLGEQTVLLLKQFLQLLRKISRQQLFQVLHLPVAAADDILAPLLGHRADPYLHLVRRLP